MSRNYQMPPDVREKEKIIGGVLNINQFLWLVCGFVGGTVLFILFMNFTNSIIISIFFALLGSCWSFPFAFYRKRDITLYQYITRKIEFKRKTHKLINNRKGECN